MEHTLGDGARYWIVYEGHNDFIDLAGPKFARSVFFERNPKALLALDALLSSPASATLRLFIRHTFPRLTSAEFERQVSLVLGVSEVNYRAMIALARAHGVRLVLSTVISNLDYPPYPENPVTDFPDSWDAANAFLHGRELYKQGRPAEGYRFQVLGRDRDPQLWRAPSGFDQLMRRLAKENPDVVTLIDLEPSLLNDYGSGPIGCNLFGQLDGRCDWVHPNNVAHAWIARQIEKVLFPNRS
jgi:hypothetical protein